MTIKSSYSLTKKAQKKQHNSSENGEQFIKNVVHLPVLSNSFPSGVFSALLTAEQIVEIPSSYGSFPYGVFSAAFIVIHNRSSYAGALRQLFFLRLSGVIYSGIISAAPASFQQLSLTF